MRTLILRNGVWAEQGSSLPTDVGLIYEANGQLPFAAPESTEKLHYVPDYLTNLLGVVSTDAELATQKTTVQSFSQVYYAYQRFSVGNWAGTATDEPAVEAELTAWQYDATNDNILCTLNTSSYVGLVGYESYSDYVFEVNVSSTDGDDDSIGLVIGYVKVDGRSLWLGVFRQFQEPDMQFYVAAFDATGVRRYISKIDNTALTQVASANGGWGSNAAGSNIKVTRVGDVFTLETSNLGSTAYVAAAKITLDLTTDATLSPFQGTSRIGYAAQSQNKSTYKVLQRPGSRLDIFDTRDASVWTYVNNAWVKQTGVGGQYVNVGRHYFSPNFNRLWFCNTGTSLALVATVSPRKATTAEAIAGTATDVILDAATAKAAWASWSGN